jgi:hypothetical protein
MDFAFANEFGKKVAGPLSDVLLLHGSSGPGLDAFVSIVFPQTQPRLDRGAWFRDSGLFRLARE